MMTDQLSMRAAAPTVEVVRGIAADRLHAPTPCTEFVVADLLRHLLFWAPSLEGAARKEVLPPTAAAEADVALDQWEDELVAGLERVATAWSVPAAWQGTTRMGAPEEVPASLIGGMVLTEMVVHGWDLAVATGQEPVWDDAVLEHVHREVVTTAPLGRRMGIYGPEVPVPGGAPLLPRILGLTGRHPATAARGAA